MGWLAGWLIQFKRTTFRRQLAILFGIGVLGVSLLAAFATSWQGSRQLYSSKLDNGLRITQTLSTQSRLALAFGSTDNVAEALETAAAFPDVTRIEIRHVDGRVLFESGNAIVGEVATNLPNSARHPYLLAENATGWRFVAPVWSLSDPDSQFEVTERKDILLGFVIIDQSKATLNALVREVFVVNFAAGLAFALFFGIGLRFLARRLIRPLANLSATMARAEKGESGLRADISGPQDLAEMAHAFNSMMVALEQREQELRTARDSALRFAKLKSDFAATVSHEIRTPLNGVIGTLDMLKLGKLNDEQQELLGLAWDSSQYLLELINNILDFSRLEAGRMGIDACDFALQPLIDGVIGMFQTPVASKGLELTATIAPAVPKILNGDPARIRQILINLIGNAVKFTERGSVTLTVEPLEDGRILRFGVRDTGIGIAEEHQSVIFDSFTQADTSTTRRYGGSGLGLSICKQIANLLGGEIGVDGKPGQGSLFWFTIPCVTGRPITLLRPDADAPALSGLRILIAEDNVTNQLVAAGMLRLIGCSSAIARNGVEAVSMWQDGDWDLILMDCSMPEMDGFQATAAIRQQEAGRGTHIPILAMTANTLPGDIEHCKESGMDDHLPKPLTLNTLTSSLEHWLNWKPDKALIPQVANDSSDQLLDSGVVTRLREILGSSIGEAVRPFLEDMPGYLLELETAIADGNAATLHQVTHVIKGAASNLGAIALAGVAREMELRAEASDFSETNELLQRLRTEFALVEPILTAELDGTSSSLPSLREDAPVVLVVDDDRSTRSALRNALQRSGFRVAEAGDGNDALIWLENNDADAVLMDALMPVMDGFDACLALKRHPRWKEIPILMITALEDRQSIERAFEVGASDFIPKPIHLSVVNQRVRRVIDATRAERHVQHLAYNDALTGLPNRLLFMEQLSRAIEHASANTTQLAVLFLDLDRFKFINDTLGHEAGDKLLATMAQRLKGCVRADDCVARLGGDEFTVLLDDLPNAAVAASVAQNICRTVSAPLIIDDQEIVITTSIGISLFPQDGPDLSRLLRHADTAMYRAKQSGSGFCYYEAAMESAVSDRLKLENDLRHALEREEFSVFYQPVIDTITGNINGVEALVRWIHPENGIVSPAEFIPVAEETGLILQLGEFVLRSACRQTKVWLDNGMPNLHVAVNLSAKQLEQPNLRNIILGALEDSGLPASALVLEITESVLMERAAESIGLLCELRKLGVHISIDDFGTGYSSLSYLKHLPANTLKIDRSFVQDMPEDEDAVAIVTGILALAHSLRMTVVAEGVETDAQRATLTRLECDCMQGFLFSKPLPAELVETRLFAPKRRKRSLKKQS
ncbi:MAG: signaling protein [Betaproteobacteria bacterium HGW-Betaproteobacteria-6]|jgi:diguanylate cyclase (GGDEF)-like protein|nr:MAG: signaling protein [Betaproteobacteria bacterium HGW-Betaproteobacteria-6]